MGTGLKYKFVQNNPQRDSGSVHISKIKDTSLGAKLGFASAAKKQEFNTKQSSSAKGTIHRQSAKGAKSSNTGTGLGFSNILGGASGPDLGSHFSPVRGVP